MKSSLIICAVFAVGIVVGAAGWAPQALLSDHATTWALYALMMLVGIGVGGSGKALRVIRKVHVKIVLVPLAVVAGTFLGAAAAAVVLPGLTVRQGLAVGAGFGYYSLSSSIIKAAPFNMGVLAAVALMTNLLREVTTLLLTPLLVRYFGKLAPIGTGGATTMDTTLPIITQEAGKEYGMIAAFSGLVLSVAVPVLVPLILSL
jgi:uncharacterized membrane protein YbjE (DUF340 family)